MVVVCLGVVGALAERSSVRLSSSVEISISVLPTLFAAVAFGPLAGMVVAAATMLGDLRAPYLKWAVYTASRSLTGAITGLVAMTARGLADQPLASVAVAAIAGALAAQALDVGFACVTVRLRRAGQARDVVAEVGRAQLVSAPFYMTVVGLLVYAFEELSPWTLLLFLIPALAAQRLFVLNQEQRRLSRAILLVLTSDLRVRISRSRALLSPLSTLEIGTPPAILRPSPSMRGISRHVWDFRLPIRSWLTSLVYT